MSELSKILTRRHGEVNAYVLFFAPRSLSRDWVRTKLWNDARAIPGVLAIVDEDGVEARRFGALTSGQALLYDSDGHILFSGGITASRGHEGDNDGSDAIISLIATQRGKRTPASEPPLLRFLRSEKVAAARRETAEELADSLGGTLDNAPVLRGFLNSRQTKTTPVFGCNLRAGSGL